MAADPRDYNVELSSQASGAAPGARPARPFISVHFACCGVYQRLYRSADGKGYRGHCPKCLRPVNFAVGAGGTDCRHFVVR
jgi:hypothetical protein